MIEKTNNFNAVYNFGPKEEQMTPQNRIVSFINSLVVVILKSFIYSGSIKKNLDVERVEKAKEQMNAIGGENIKIKTPDGDVLDACYLDAKKLKNYISHYCDLIETENKDGTVSQKWILKKEYYEIVDTTYIDGSKGKHAKPNQEAEKFIANIKGLGIANTPFSKVYSKEETEIRGFLINEFLIPKEAPRLQEGANQPTALLAGGSGMPYSAYKSMAISYLMRGMNVMMVDFRGYGASTGTPTDYRTRLDLESAYQYLVKEKGVENDHLLIHGHCLGAGSASDLAARRKGVNLILDRTFADYKEVAKERFPLFRRLIEKIMPHIVDYNNAKNIARIENGNIGIVMAKKDSVIPEEQIWELIDHLPNSFHGKTFKLLDSPGQHTGVWTDYDETRAEFDQFLEQSHLLRRLF